MVSISWKFWVLNVLAHSKILNFIDLHQFADLGSNDLLHFNNSSFNGLHFLKNTNVNDLRWFKKKLEF